MKIGLWNIDHAEYHPSSTYRSQRYEEITLFLSQQNCDIFVITEGNAAIQMEGYQSYFSVESPFLKKTRYYQPPNKYHQVGIYSRLPLRHFDITEPINGLLCEVDPNNHPLLVYGNVITLKDQWKKDSDKTYTHRLEEQLEAFAQLANKQFIICGDFNLKLGWPQKKKAYQRLKNFVDHHGYAWPTEMRTDTVQHILHSPGINVEVTIDPSIQHDKGKINRLSDHPFVAIEVGRS